MRYQVINNKTNEVEDEFYSQDDAIECIDFEFSFHTHRIIEIIPLGMVATIKFKTDRGTDWYVTKEFTDKKHMNNFINYICRTKFGYTLDEVFLD